MFLSYVSSPPPLPLFGPWSPSGCTSSMAPLMCPPALLPNLISSPRLARRCASRGLFSRPLIFSGRRTMTSSVRISRLVILVSFFDSFQIWKSLIAARPPHTYRIPPTPKLLSSKAMSGISRAILSFFPSPNPGEFC